MSESRNKLKSAPSWAVVLAVAVGSCAGQPTQVHLQSQGKAVDFSGAASTRPVRVGSSLPSSCLTGEQFHLVTAPAGQNLYLCVSMNTWAAVTNAGTGGAEEAQGLNDCRFERTSAQVLTMAACRVRTGTTVWNFPETAFSLSSGSAADTAYFYVMNGSLVAGYSLTSTTVSGSGFATESGVSSFPAESLPLEKWGATTTPGQWDGSGTDMRVLLQRSVVEAGVGLTSVDNSSTGVRTLSLDTATTPQFTSGTAEPPTSCSAGQLYVRTSSNQAYQCTSANTWTEITDSGLADPGSNGIMKRTALNTTAIATDGTDYLSPSGSAVLTNKTLDAEATGNNITTVELSRSVAAKCQSGAATASANLPAENSPTPVCVNGTNTLFAVLQWPDADGDYGIQDSFRLPLDWSGNIDFSLKWRTSATTGDVVWQLSTACVADGETSDPTFNTAQTITDTAKETADQQNDASVSGVTTTGCAAGETLYWKLLRNRTHASDTLAAAAELISYEFKFRRMQ